MILGEMTPFVDRGIAGLKWTVHWEDSERPEVELYMAIDAAHADLIAPNDHVSLLSALPSAARYGEKQIRVPSADPWLVEGLDVVQAYYKHWQGIRPVEVTAASVRSASAPPERSSAVFFSGGVDSMSSLRRNVDSFPAGHPGRVTHALHVDLAGPEDLSDLNGSHTKKEIAAVRQLEKATSDLGVTIVPVVTNIRALDGYEFDRDWMFHSHGTVLASIAHAFEFAFSRVLIASTYDVAHMDQWGSHPLTDGRLSSSTFTFTHHNEQFSRQDKVELIADWQAGREALDVCFRWFNREAGGRNCGECEKCQRTIAGLMIADVDVDSTGVFDKTLFTQQTLSVFGRFADDYERASWMDIEAGLRRMGHPAAQAVTARIKRDNLSRRLNNRFTRPLLVPAKTAYGVFRKVRGS